jgi:hypothetical protein
MASFEKKDFPEISYCITDDYKREVQLTPEQVYDLLQWLYDRRDELIQALHPAVKEPSWVTPETLQAWQRAKATVEAYNRDHPFVSAEQEEAAKPPTVRYLEIRLYQHEWPHLDALRAAIPHLHEQYSAPVSEETHGPVKVFSVRYNTLSQEAINLIQELQVEYRFNDVLVPTGDDTK